nr:unnamed protein product [Callosobruchus analis]
MSSSSDEEDIVMLLWYQRDDKKKTTMSKECYTHLVETLAPAIHYVDTNMRECVTAEERILITLRYLATGCTFVALGLYFCRGETTVGQIVSETATIIWNQLKDAYMPCPTHDRWMSIAQRFQAIWNLPNCIGALDGKHIRIEKLPNTGSTNFNYKSYHSIVLLGCCDADGIFAVIETGYAGRNSDGGIFRASSMKNLLSNSQLDIPPPSKLPLDDYDDCRFPYYFVGDEAFPLSGYLMRPYSKRSGRKTIECTFGMMTEKFQVLSTAIRVRDENAVNNIIKSVCVLHNYVRTREGRQYLPQQLEQNVSIPGSINLNAQAARAKINIGSNAFALHAEEQIERLLRKMHKVLDAMELDDWKFIKLFRLNKILTEKLIEGFSIYKTSNKSIGDHKKFYEKYQFPGVVGIIDYTHVAITTSYGEYQENDCVNRKNYHSVNVQLICDENLKIMNVDARFQGSCNDIHIWKQSSVSKIMEQFYRNNPNHLFYLLSDSGKTKY